MSTERPVATITDIRRVALGFFVFGCTLGFLVGWLL